MDDFLKNVVFSNIDDVWEISEPRSVIILGTVKEISKEVGWFSLKCPNCLNEACTKNMGLTKFDGGCDEDQHTLYVCTNEFCRKNVIDEPVLRLKVRVKDSSGDVSLILFHNTANHVIEKSAKQLVQDNTLDDGTVRFPNELKTLVDKLFAFKIEVSESNLTYCDEEYEIQRITDDESVVDVVKQMSGISQRCMLDDKKNGTPISLVMSSDGDSIDKKTCSMVCKETTSKRKLLDLYNLDVISKSSICESTSNNIVESVKDVGKKEIKFTHFNE
ncbi:uncharacterized protein LOC118479543 [Helianthus annuus]|uniref:uncharacterized protein LOC118479543 n=1 Tax=Helianthus annuus TaxID=4232 RepID=UPI001652E98E|nr:uncharacterized protein LOC118479543 [Helianthus annuus]